MVTLVTALASANESSISIDDISCKVSKQAESMIGTTASLVAGQVFKLKDLFYGRMSLISFDAAIRK